MPAKSARRAGEESEPRKKGLQFYKMQVKRGIPVIEDSFILLSDLPTDTDEDDDFDEVRVTERDFNNTFVNNLQKISS